jgi:tetratricopeptide (TPR) repeat protein
MVTPTLDDWLRLAPRAPTLGADQQYHIFISYRSVNRMWALHLYDVLTQLGYKVFLDQFVLPAGAPLASSLGLALGASGAATMIWSSSFEDSKWCLDEFNALMARRNADEAFRFVIVTVDGTKVPALAAGNIRVDFSSDRDGPAGSNLLRLLYGLNGNPLPPEAVRYAADFDDQFLTARSRIKTASELGNKKRLAELASSTDLVWQTSPALGCQAAEALIGLDDTDAALVVLQALQSKFPRAIRPKQLQGLALARARRYEEAAEVLGELYNAGELDPETFGLYARTWMDRYNVTKRPDHLRRSRDLYLQAFERSKDSYNGINAASKSLFLGERAQSLALAARVQAIVGTAALSKDYWGTATVAEVQLLQGQFDAAATLYQQAVLMDTEAHGSHRSTCQQAVKILDALAAPADVRTKVLAAFDHDPCRMT